MKTTILQVPLDVKLRNQAATSAAKMGFSSLQEAVRIFLRKMADRKIDLTFEETIQLSPKAARRYEKLDKDIETGKEPLYTANSVEDLLDQLHGRKRPVLKKISQKS
jgi:antitoxin component of RelBE/YafQ-DinJ toxin-antitoxin module